MNSEKRKQREEEAKRQWAVTRETGKMKYIFRNWVLGYGLTMALVFFLYKQIDNSWEHWVFDIIASFVIFTLTGFLVGLINWNQNEKRYIGKK